jgi:acyl carrier protein
MSDWPLSEVQEVFRKVFQRPGLMVERMSTAETIDGWDSLTHMRLISALEARFNIVFTFNEVSGFNDVGDMVEVIRKKVQR